MMKGKNWNPENKYWGMSAEQIKKMWSDNGSSVSGAGTDMHYEIECFMNHPDLESYTHLDLLNEYKKERDTCEQLVEARNSPEWEYFMKFVEENPELKLVIVGREIDEFYSRSVREMANALRVTDAVEFLGHVNPPELSELYENCHIFVFPSTVETFGNPLLEAMSFGLPIACSNTAAMPEVIGDAGLFDFLNR